MTEDKLQELNTDFRKISNLESWLVIASRSENPRARLNALFEVNGWVSDDTLQKCYDLVRPELDDALSKLKKGFEEA